LVDEETYESVELMGKLIARFEQREGLLRPPVEERPIIVVMNHWSSIDLACHILEKHPEYKVYYRQAIENNQPIFPEQYTLKWLLRKQEIDPYTFANQYMNNPVDRSITENKLEWLQKYKRTEAGVQVDHEDKIYDIPIGHMNIYASGDPRHSLADTAAQKLTSRNAISVDGIDARGLRFHLDEYAARSSPEEFLRAMADMHRKWHPIQFGIESFGYQAALAPLSKLIWKDDHDTPNLELLPRDTSVSKKNRIRGALRFYAEGTAYTHKLLPMFNEEYITFPHGNTMDMLDCWAWNMHLMQMPDTEMDYEDEERIYKEHLQNLRSGAKI